MCRGVQIFSTLAMSPCQNIKKFICEKEASGPLENSGNSDTGCPKGWKNKFGNCYGWFFTEMRTWQEAENHCNKEGQKWGRMGHLASIRNADEMEFFDKTLRGTVWVGGQKVGSKWTWSDGTPWNFGSIPIDTVYAGDCSQTFGSMFGRDCSMERLYICKMEAS